MVIKQLANSLESIYRISNKNVETWPEREKYVKETVKMVQVIYACLTSDNFPLYGRNSHETARSTAGDPRDLSCKQKQILYG